MKPFAYKTAVEFLDKFSYEDKLELYGAFGGTPLYLQQVNPEESFEENLKRAFLKNTSYLYEEPLLLLRQEVQEPGVYSAIIEAIAGGYTKANEISMKIGEETAKCLKYIKTLCELGLVFEKVCMDYLIERNAKGELPILFTSIGRWWGTDSATRTQIEIDLIANDGREYLIGECKWRNEKLDLSVLQTLKEKADVFSKNRERTWFFLFSKSGFTQAVMDEAEKDETIILINLDELMM